MYIDPLFVTSSKIRCPVCGGGRRERRNCPACDYNGWKPVDMNGFWSPSPGFLVCGGPSINKEPGIYRLRERGIVSLAVNNIAGHVPVTAWCFSDPQSKFHHGMHLDPKILTFAPIPKLRYGVRVKLPDGTFRSTGIPLRDCPGTFGFSRKTTFDAKTFLTTNYAHWGLGGGAGEERPFTCLCTMLLGVRLMCYLGCPRIYMLGVDFKMTEEEQYAFGQKCNPHNGRYRKENEMLSQIKPVLEAAGVTMFNCNPESGCDVFPKVPFQDAFDDCKGAVPDEPFDLTDWYSSRLAERQEQLYPAPVTLQEVTRLQREARRLPQGAGN